MNWTVNRLLNSSFRREPVASVAIVMGSVDIAIGGAEGAVGLAVLGLGLVGLSAGIYWWNNGSRQIPGDRVAAPAPGHRSPLYLPARSDQARLPMLMVPRKPRPDDYPD